MGILVFLTFMVEYQLLWKPTILNSRPAIYQMCLLGVRNTCGLTELPCEFWYVFSRLKSMIQYIHTYFRIVAASSLSGLLGPLAYLLLKNIQMCRSITSHCIFFPRIQYHGYTVWQPLPSKLNRQNTGFKHKTIAIMLSTIY